MKTTRRHWGGCGQLRQGGTIAIGLFLVAIQPTCAQTSTPYTATGWVTSEPALPLFATNALGQVSIRAGVQTIRVQSADVRLTGQRRVFLDGAYQTDGTAILYGTAYQEVGTWNLADPQNPQFVPTGGLWEITYRGTMPPDQSFRLHLVGYGTGGKIEGLRLEEDMTRAAGAIVDPALPYQYIGSLKPPPLNTAQILDDFNDNKLNKNWEVIASVGLIETSQQLKMRGYWPGVRTTDIIDTVGAALYYRPWSLKDGQTVEWRVDLISMNEHATAAVIEPWTGRGAYVFFKGKDFIHICKYGLLSRICGWAGVPVVFQGCGREPLRGP